MSTISNIGDGLFSNIDIKKGSIIIEFKGKLKKQGCASKRSNILFNDGFFLECPVTDLASYANDAINFTGIRRKLVEALCSREPFYTKHSGINVNAEIKLNDKLHRAFLIATRDISVNSEIFCHYGFMYWFQQELALGFLQENEIEENGFPEKIFEYPAFTSYIKHFYPEYISHAVEAYDNCFDIILSMKGGWYYIISIDNFANKIEKILA